MSSAFYANCMTLQVSEHEVRVIFTDSRPGVHMPDAMLHENPVVGAIVGEVILNPANARALRDLLVTHVKDGGPPMETPNV